VTSTSTSQVVTLAKRSPQGGAVTALRGAAHHRQPVRGAGNDGDNNPRHRHLLRRGVLVRRPKPNPQLTLVVGPPHEQTPVLWHTSHPQAPTRISSCCCSQARPKPYASLMGTTTSLAADLKGLGALQAHSSSGLPDGSRIGIRQATDNRFGKCPLSRLALGLLSISGLRACIDGSGGLTKQDEVLVGARAKRKVGPCT
jgi:hypothetical protein